MAVHVPLSLESQAEARLLMLASNNILSPATGRPIITPSQDMVLGCYYLTAENPLQQEGSGQFFAHMEDAITAYSQGAVALHAYVWLRFDGGLESDEPEAELLLMNDTELLTIDIPGKPSVRKGNIVLEGAELAPGVQATRHGQVVQVSNTQIVLRGATLYPIGQEPANEQEVTKVYLGKKTKTPLRIVREDQNGNVISQYIHTTPGRIIYNKTIQDALVS